MDLAQGSAVVGACEYASRGGPIRATACLLWQVRQPHFKGCKSGHYPWAVAVSDLYTEINSVQAGQQSGNTTKIYALIPRFLQFS
jgi:hypothetical protein